MYKTTFSLKHFTKKSLYVLINNMKHSSMYLPMANKTPVILINQKVQNIGHFHLAPMFNPPFTFMYYLLTTNIRNTGYIYLPSMYTPFKPRTYSTRINVNHSI